jgi:5'(3')-deoxyribonucleotidase
VDGVLVDLASRAKDLFDIELTGHRKIRDKAKEALFWTNVTAMYVQGKGQLWRPAAPMSDMTTLWDFIKRYNPTICTSRGKIPQGADEKRQWVEEHLEPTPPVIVVDSGSKKAQYATPTSILIDDTHHVIEKFRAAGGIGILHTSAADTIRQLKEIIDK